jgi:hypothetical protein
MDPKDDRGIQPVLRFEGFQATDEGAVVTVFGGLVLSLAFCNLTFDLFGWLERTVQMAKGKGENHGETKR